MELVAGIDAGTQSLKVVVYDPDARSLVASASAPLELTSAADGSREQRPDDWVAALQGCFAAIDPALRSRIAALAVSGQQHGFVPIDAAGKVLAPAKLWCDTSTSAECVQIMDAVGGTARTIALAGNPVLQSADATSLIHIVLKGGTLPATHSAPSTFTMPPFAWRLSDQEVADVVNFIRGSWGNQASAVKAGDVAALRNGDLQSTSNDDLGPFTGH